MIYLLETDNRRKIIAKNPIYAKKFLDRLFGLIFRNFSENFDGIVFWNCNLIHSCFMRYEFDLIFLLPSGEVVKIYEFAKIFRFFYGGRRTDLIAIELPKGTIEKFGIKVGSIIDYGSFEQEKISCRIGGSIDELVS